VAEEVPERDGADGKCAAVRADGGVDHTTAYQLRERDPRFASDWARARDWGRARVKAEGRPVFAGGRPRPARPGEAPADARELIVRLSKRQGSQIVRAGEGRWSPGAEAEFFAWLAAGFGVSHAARQIGFSTTALYRRRQSEPDFAARWAEVLKAGLERNDGLLIDSVPRALDPDVIAAAADGLPRPSIAEAIQIQRLYRTAAGGTRRGREPEPPAPDAKAIFDRLSQRVEEIEQQKAAGKLASGWAQDEDGNWIPPGWVRKDAA
jgi:hypothetical protein